MKVNPISSTINNRTTFKANIQPTESLKKSFDMLEKYSKSHINKDMNSVKEFLDSLAKINQTEKIKDFKIEIDKRRPDYTYTRINGRRISGGTNYRMSSLQDSYLTIEGVKKYAAKLGKFEYSPLDELKAQVEEAEMHLEELKERYSNRLKAEFEQAKKMIFQDA